MHKEILKRIENRLFCEWNPLKKQPVFVSRGLFCSSPFFVSVKSHMILWFFELGCKSICKRGTAYGMIYGIQSSNCKHQIETKGIL